nr:MAG TPA: hypothetical protein [Caudoviricetes sp.]
MAGIFCLFTVTRQDSGFQTLLDIILVSKVTPSK